MSAPLPEVGTGVAAPAESLAAALAALGPLRAAPPASSASDRLAALEGLADALLERRARPLPGGAFLAAFLRRDHLEALLRRELPEPGALDAFVPAGPRCELRIFPRGAVCHWIAGNVPLLGVFSWALSALFGNVNLVRTSSRNEDLLSPLVEHIAGLGEAGAEMAARTRVVSFAREDEASHRAMSRFADLRVAWGGEEAVSAVKGLPARWECEDLVFGPRRSYAVVEPRYCDERMIARLANDAVYFDQLACSSPQILFVRGAAGDEAVEAFTARFAEAVEAAARRFRRHALDWGETYLIELDRQRAVLEGGRVRRDAATEWTVAALEAPDGRLHCANRFVQVVPFAEVAEIAARLPENPQTVIVAAAGELAREVAEQLGRAGACRFPRPGMGNSFELPWDGIAVAPRLGRWVTRAS